eukprot:SAG11_NODE_5144_length_1651_cov_1.095361_2_plen_162_part_00
MTVSVTTLQIPMPTWSDELLAAEKAAIRRLLQAVGARDSGRFREELRGLSHNPSVQMMTLVLLRGHAKGQGAIHRPIEPLDGVLERERAEIWSGFAALDRALQHPGGEEILKDGFLNSMGSRGSAYEYYSMPEWTVDDFIDSWPSDSEQPGFGEKQTRARM